MIPPAKYFLGAFVLLAGLVGRMGAAPKSNGETEAWVKAHTLSEEAFIRACGQPATVVLDTSSLETYRLLHVSGAVHLGTQDMTAESLAKILPDKDVRVLLYHNNNYRALVQKSVRNREAAVHVLESSSEISRNTAARQRLRGLGYRNVWELAPYVRVDRSKLPLVTNAMRVDLARPVTLSLAHEPRAEEDF